jgi:ATP-dependent DNA helicase DinG
MKVEDRLTPSSIEKLRSAIAENSGNEIFVVGRLDREKKVYEIEIAARGNQKAVPLLRPFLERGEVVIHNHPGAILIPSEPDLAIASQLGNDGIGFFIVDNDVLHITVVAEPVSEEKKVLLDDEVLAATILPDGMLSQIYPGYEQRDAQIDMLRSVCRSFNLGTITIVEAGTGVGKSLAYLIPAVEWVMNNRERIVISTATINLQQQLLEKDIPLVGKILGKKPKVALVKGRGNYLCLSRLKETIAELSLFEEMSSELESISEWALTTKSGSRDDLSIFPTEEIWSTVCSEADLCLGLKCKMRGDCFVIKARKEASKAQILVVNNHLLFSDLSIRMGGLGFKSNAVLPPFQRIVFDEAHNIEKSATSFFSEQFSKYALQRGLRRLYRKKGKKVYGLLLAMEKRGIKKSNILKLKKIIQEILIKGDLLNNLATELMADQKSLYILEVAENKIGQYLINPLQELETLLLEFINIFSDLMDKDNQEWEEEDILLLEIKIQARRMMRILEICKQFQKYKEKKDMIFWLDSFKNNKGNKIVRFVITPLDITAMMKKAVYEPYESLIFTSATLTVANNFSYWKTRVGLTDMSDREVTEIALSSPFNYKEQVLLCIPNNAPMPNEKLYKDFIEKIILEIIELFEGRALVLFTSYETLFSTYTYVKEKIKNKKIIVLKQGDEDRHKLLKSFIRITNSALFATDSFWEGVDSPGETLSVVIICRLPFKVPTDPITIARMEYIRQKGGNPFLEFSLPEAVIRLRQGFGRLMRSKQDRGAVVILDSRIIKKAYGEAFLASLPQTGLSITEKESMLVALENFMFA